MIDQLCIDCKRASSFIVDSVELKDKTEDEVKLCLKDKFGAIVSQFEKLGFKGEKAKIASLSFLSTASQIGVGKSSKAITELLKKEKKGSWVISCSSSPSDDDQSFYNNYVIDTENLKVAFHAKNFRSIEYDLIAPKKTEGCLFSMECDFKSNTRSLRFEKPQSSTSSNDAIEIENKRTNHTPAIHYLTLLGRLSEAKSLVLSGKKNELREARLGISLLGEREKRRLKKIIN